MATLTLYLGITVLGYLAGAKAGMRPRPRLLTATIAILILIMGTRIGASEEILSSLGTIGLRAFLFTLITMAAAVLVLALVRRLVGFDRCGRRSRTSTTVKSGTGSTAKSGAGIETTASSETSTAKSGTGTTAKSQTTTAKSGTNTTKPGINKMTVLIIACVALGILAGRFVLPAAFMERTGTMLTVCLCLLLALTGIDIGSDETIGESFRAAGWRVLMIPLASVLAVGVSGLIAAPLLSMSLKDALCIGAGFGWYTLAPAMLATYSAEVSALSFLHNVMRELLGLVLVPFVASKFGYIECLALPGSSTMDVCLPVIEQSTNGTVAIYSFINGTLLAATVPVLESLFLSL